MPDGERVLRVVREWVEKAENDLKAAARLLRSGRGFPADVVCFHAQQCVEKYLKAYLASVELDFPKTHDLSVLLSLVPLRVRPKLTVPEQRTLTMYATVARYPGSTRVAAAEARRALKLTRRVRKELGAVLPKDVRRPNNR